MVTCLFVREEEDGTIAIDAEREQMEERVWIRTEGGTKKYEKWLRWRSMGSIYRREFIVKNQLWFPGRVRYEDNYWGHFLHRRCLDIILSINRFIIM